MAFRQDMLAPIACESPMKSLAREPIERGLVELTLGVGLLGLRVERNRSRTTSAMATMSPELILASYSCARRDHMVRLTRARPLSVSSARLTIGGSASLRMPTRGFP